MTAWLLALALSAAAQSPAPISGDEPPPGSQVAASTEAAVAVSTEEVKAAPKPSPKPRLHAVIQPEAKDWEPLSLRAGGNPDRARTEVVLRLAKAKGQYKGKASKAKAFARLRKAGPARWLVVSVFPKEFEKRRRHFEVGLRLVEGFVEGVKASLVTVVDRRPDVGAGLDSDELRARGVEFEEDSPESGEVVVSSLDPRPSKSALNSGVLKLAAFEDKDVRLADISWSAAGLPPAR